jgi:hypothetical protein
MGWLGVGVDQFVDDPLVSNKLIYKTRFGRASTIYAEIGSSIWV